MPSNTKKHKDISRIDQKDNSTLGWYVRVRYQGKTHSKFIADRKHGGKDEGLNKAIEWRNETEQRIGKLRTDRHMATSTIKSSTGVIGVRLNLQPSRYEVAWVSKDSKQKRTSFSINKYGKTKAFKLACDLRRKKDAERLASSD